MPQIVTWGICAANPNISFDVWSDLAYLTGIGWLHQQSFNAYRYLQINSNNLYQDTFICDRCLYLSITATIDYPNVANMKYIGLCHFNDI